MLRNSVFHYRKVFSVISQQARKAEVVSDPFHFYVPGGKNNWDTINKIAAEASKVKIDYDTKYALKLKEAALKRGVSVKELKDMATEINKNVNKTLSIKSTKKVETDTNTIFKEYRPYLNKLEQIVKLELIEKESKENIARIWTQYYSNKDGITAVIPTSSYDKMYRTSQKYPMFILPMPRENGLEFFFLQFQEHQCHITSLLEYKTKCEKARPFLTITHFSELAKSKGIILMRGEINDDPKKMLTASNAQFLAFALQQFYSTDNPRRHKLIKLFNEMPDKFNYRELIKEMEEVISLK